MGASLKQTLWRIPGFIRPLGVRTRWRPSLSLAVVGTLAITAVCVTLLTFERPHSSGSTRQQSSATSPQLSVIDGDTVRWQGSRVRLVGFNTPEAGDRAGCPSERAKAASATARLRSLVASGNAKVELVRCACPRGTEGTNACNFGRHCGVLTINGRDVGHTLISEGLARPYRCSSFSCPPRGSWC